MLGLGALVIAAPRIWPTAEDSLDQARNTTNNNLFVNPSLGGKPDGNWTDYSSPTPSEKHVAKGGGVLS